ncbi:hypothetical protein CWC33_06275 [Idiomarina sp. X4]|uniref:DUF5343 domain-containing protein n=1 Tax=Idiomarina sp. X4 TaxID=2055892 RepID=UPI000C288A82|nr:DUF5343 domain-containing protein [Idiomarina sp. X4]ATZ73327.1 hypothetical protein CWC33_06275 [Idiomarina sp. X4]
MADNLPYSTSVGVLEKVLEKIKTASVPERVTQNFLNTKLGLKGGSANASIPFMKKMGFVASDGSPTELYSEFRNPKKSRIAVGKAFKDLYARLYEMNEYVHDASDDEVLGLIVQSTGGEKDSRVTQQTLSTFNMLRKLADFDTETLEAEESEHDRLDEQKHLNQSVPLPQFNHGSSGSSKGKSINLAYTINLNLPATKDIEVFNAIFKSLKQHILDD